MGFNLSPEVIAQASSYNPFNMNLALDTAEFTEDVMFVGATTKPIKDQTVVELTLKIMPHSSTNPNIQFRTDLWLNDAICAGRVRPADADERDWKNTKSALRTLGNLQKALGIPGTNPVDALTDPSVAGQGTAGVTIRVYRANNGQHKWDLNRVGKAKVGA